MNNTHEYSAQPAVRALSAGTALAALALGLLLAFSLLLNAGPARAAGGFTGPGPSVVTVEQAKSMSDDTNVTLRGYITQSLGDEKYLFKDDTGTITVEIDDDDWRGLQVGPTDLVEIQGEVDKEWTRTEIDVDRVIRAQ